MDSTNNHDEKHNSDISEHLLLIASTIRESLKSRESPKPKEEGEKLIELIRTLTKESTKSYRHEFAEIMGLTKTGLDSLLYDRKIAGKHLANILLQLSNLDAEEFISEFMTFIIEKKNNKKPEWYSILSQLRYLTEEEKNYIATIAWKFDNTKKNIIKNAQKDKINKSNSE